MQKIYYRFKERGGEFFEGYVADRKAGLIAIAPYSGAALGWHWFKESELEIIPYNE